MMTDTSTASTFDTAARGDLVQLTDNEIDAVGGGFLPLIGLAILLGLSVSMLKSC